MEKRSDGYHNLETVFYPLPLTDILEIIPGPPAKVANVNAPTFSQSGLTIAGNPGSNLCLKAWSLLRESFPDLPVPQIHLHKIIPMGAGLGGGSADGAFTLKMLNNLFRLQISEPDLAAFALKLGSDCPFFIGNKPVFATGRGESLFPVKLDLSLYKMVIVNPGIHISTKEAFSKLTPSVPVKSVQQVIGQPVTTWKDNLFNDFEKPVFSLYPAIAEIKESLYKAGALYAAMTGSGSTVYGIFEQNTPLNLSFPENYVCITPP